MASGHATLAITSDLRELPRLRAFLEQACRQHYDPAPDADDLWKLLLAATEATSNIILHAYQRRPGESIRAELEMQPSRLTLRLYHRGHAFEGDPALPTELEGPREDHMGLYLIGQAVDSLTYSRTAAGEHCVELVKSLKGPA
jgi:anti-sigma regulatory factor (Ser/Thr protein kinase)